MHLLTCPACQTPFPIATSQAGQRTGCPHCENTVDVPTLGQLRQLPMAPSELSTAEATKERTAGGSAAFLVLGLIATAALVVASFCGIRWAIIDVPVTSEEHIASLNEAYQNLSPAQLIREYEQMEELGIDLRLPYPYKQTEMLKDEWGRSAMISGLVGGLAVIAAMIVAATGLRGRSRVKEG